MEKLDIDFDKTKYDLSNPLVLDPKSSKPKTKSKSLDKNNIKPKILSKKQRKRRVVKSK